MMISNKSVYKLIQIFALSAVFLVIASAQANAGSLPGLPGIGGWLSGVMSTISSAISTALSAMTTAINGILGAVSTTLASLGLGPLWGVLMTWAFGAGNCGQATMPSGTGVGQMMCNVVMSIQTLPGFVAAIAYAIGLVCAVTALIKLKDHVINPNQTPLSDSMKRFVAGGAFFSLPIVTSAARSLITGNGTARLDNFTITKIDGSGVSGGYGLDTMLVALVSDILQPMMNLIGGFSYLAGIVLIVIGIGRLLKTAQEGPRGPSGVGTIMTFVTAGILFSLDGVMGAFTSSLGGDEIIETYGVLDQSTGDGNVDVHINTIIASVVGFMMIVGWVSFVRGFFIIRDVAEGNHQASLMAGVTHIFGGALAVNLGPVMNAVQSTFGLTGYGLTFN